MRRVWLELIGCKYKKQVMVLSVYIVFRTWKSGACLNSSLVACYMRLSSAGYNTGLCRSSTIPVWLLQSSEKSGGQKIPMMKRNWRSLRKYRQEINNLFAQKRYAVTHDRRNSNHNTISSHASNELLFTYWQSRFLYAILIPTFKVGKTTKGDYGYETAYQYCCCYDDEDTHVDMSHVHDLPLSSFRCALRFKSKPLRRLNFGGITIAYNRETSREPIGIFL